MCVSLSLSLSLFFFVVVCRTLLSLFFVCVDQQSLFFFFFFSLSVIFSPLPMDHQTNKNPLRLSLAFAHREEVDDIYRLARDEIVVLCHLGICQIDSRDGINRDRCVCGVLFIYRRQSRKEEKKSSRSSVVVVVVVDVR